MKFDPAQPSTDMHITINDGISKETMSSKMEPYLSNIEATQQHDKSHTFDNLFTALPMESSTEITVGSYGIFSRHGSIMKRQARFNIIPCKVASMQGTATTPSRSTPLPLAQQQRVRLRVPPGSFKKANRSNNNAIAINNYYTRATRWNNNNTLMINRMIQSDSPPRNHTKRYKPNEAMDFPAMITSAAARPVKTDAELKAEVEKNTNNRKQSRRRNGQSNNNQTTTTSNATAVPPTPPSYADATAKGTANNNIQQSPTTGGRGGHGFNNSTRIAGRGNGRQPSPSVTPSCTTDTTISNTNTSNLTNETMKKFMDKMDQMVTKSSLNESIGNIIDAVASKFLTIVTDQIAIVTKNDQDTNNRLARLEQLLQGPGYYPGMPQGMPPFPHYAGMPMGMPPMPPTSQAPQHRLLSHERQLAAPPSVVPPTQVHQTQEHAPQQPPIIANIAQAPHVTPVQQNYITQTDLTPAFDAEVQNQVISPIDGDTTMAGTQRVPPPAVDNDSIVMKESSSNHNNHQDGATITTSDIQLTLWKGGVSNKSVTPKKTVRKKETSSIISPNPSPGTNKTVMPKKTVRKKIEPTSLASMSTAVTPKKAVRKRMLAMAKNTTPVY
jgi:hypothetical protein